MSGQQKFASNPFVVCFQGSSRHGFSRRDKLGVKTKIKGMGRVKSPFLFPGPLQHPVHSTYPCDSLAEAHDIGNWNGSSECARQNAPALRTRLRGFQSKKRKLAH